MLVFFIKSSQNILSLSIHITICKTSFFDKKIYLLKNIITNTAKYMINYLEIFIVCIENCLKVYKNLHTNTETIK